MLQLTLSAAPNLQAALDALDPGILPSAEEIETVLRKRLTKDRLTLETLGPEASIQEGDAVLFAITGEKPKYNKPKLMVTVGQGLYSKELEPGFVGHQAGDAYADTAEGLPVQIRILEIRRKVVPEPTDEMAAALAIPGVSTVEEYRAHLTKELTDNAVYPAAGELVQKLVEQAAPSEPDESVVKRLGDLEWSFFRTYIQGEKGIDLDALTPDELFEQMHVHTREEFTDSDMRKLWYRQKAKTCVVLAAALGLTLTGELDPLEHYEVLSTLQEKVADKVREALKTRRN